MAAFNIGLTITAKNTSGRALKKVQGDLDKTRKKARSTTKAFNGLRLALGLIAFGSLINLGKSIVDVTGRMQLMLIRLATVEGGAKKARVTFDKLFKTFGASPFTISAVTDSFIRLRAAGIDSTLALRAVTAAADGIAAFGGTSDELRRFSIGLQQVAGKGVLSMEELRQQIGEALPIAMRAFATETGRSISEVISDVEDGKIATEEFFVGLTTGLEKRYGGFATKLGSTLKGSIQELHSIVEKSFAGDLFQDDVAIRLTIIIQNITKEIEKFFESLTVKDVDNFFERMRRGANILLGFGEVIIFIGQLVVTFFDILTNVSSNGLGAAGSLGAIGLALFGPVGGIGGILVGLALAKIASLDFFDSTRKSISESQEAVRKINNRGQMPGELSIGDVESTVKEAFPNGPKNLADRIFDAPKERMAKLKKIVNDIKNGGKIMEETAQGLGKQAIKALTRLKALDKKTESSLIGAASFSFVKKAKDDFNRLDAIMEDFSKSQEEFDKLRALGGERTKKQTKQFEALGRSFAKVNALRDKAKEQILKKKAIDLAKELEKANNTAAKIIAKFELFAFPLTKAQEAVAKITEDFRSHEESLKKQLKELIKIAEVDGIQSKEIEKLRALLAKIPDLKQRALDISNQQAAIEEKILKTNAKLLSLQAAQEILALKKEARGAFGILTSTDSGDEAQERKLELKIQIEEIEERMLAIAYEMKELVEGDPTIEKLKEELALLKKIKEEKDKLKEATSASGVAAKKMWKSVENSMVSASEKGIKALITGTGSLRDITLKAMDEMTDAAIKYLVELIRIHLQIMLTRAIDAFSAPGGGVGSAITSFFGAANGAVAGGKIKTFASGGIISGPTMFGLAGEAGDEAIMPLTRIGGKLGVATTGGGGDSYAITIQAIDTQTGAEFLRKNMPSIIGQLQSANNLNRGVGRIR